MATKYPKLTCENADDVRLLRTRLGLRQDKFWGRIGVKQSAGSRYESGGNPLALHVAWLLHIAYGTKTDADELIAWLRQPRDE